MYCATVYLHVCQHACKSLYICCVVLYQTSFASKPKRTMQGQDPVLTSQTGRSSPILQLKKKKKKDWLKWIWGQTKETEFSTGFTTITTEACDSHSSYLSIAPTLILLLTTGACLEIQRCSVSFSNAHTYSHLNAGAQAHKHTQKQREIHFMNTEEQAYRTLMNTHDELHLAMFINAF